MSYRRLLRDNLIKRVRPDFSQIGKQIDRAQKDLKASEANVSIDLSWAVTIAYHAMIRAGRALIYSRGYLPTTRQTHKTIVKVTSLILGKEYSELIAKFNRLRRKRHVFIYDSVNHTTVQEARSAIKAARKFVDESIAFIKGENPQKELKF